MPINQFNKIFKWKKLNYQIPNLFFVPKNFDEISQYEEGFKVEELYINNNTGIQTKRDGFVYQYSDSEIRILLMI
jgi:hypothetical protein